MKLKTTLWAAIILLLALASCKRDTPLNNQDDSKPGTGSNAQVDVKDLVVPANFSFQTGKTLNVRVGVTNASSSERFVIRVYADVPSTGALLTSGFTDANHEYATTLRVPGWQEYVYIEKVDANGSSKYEKVKANQFVKALFNNGQTKTYFFRKSGSGMDCSSGCTNTYNNRSSNITANSGQTICLTGTFGSKIDIRAKNGGIIKICASGDVDDIVVEGGGKIYVLEDANITADKLDLQASSAEFKNWSENLSFDYDVNIDGLVENHGTMSSTVQVDVEDDGVLKNYGTLTIDNYKKLKSYGKVYNYHHLTVASDIENKSSGEIYNYCLLKTSDDFKTEGYLWNSGYVRAEDDFNSYSYSETELENGALLSTYDLYLENDIKGTGSDRSKVKVEHYTYIYGGGDLEGKVDLCDSSGVEYNTGQVHSPSAISCDGYIPTSTCIPEGFGVPQIQDADNDGVADNLDEYPNDADRAFNSYYPSATTMSTLAFEDLWPATGDFDYNDMVLLFNIHKVLNADNKVVDYKVKLKVKAVGAAFDNGFGFQLDEVSPSAVQTVTGQQLVNSIVNLSSNKTEASQDKAVIICFDSPEPSIHRAAGSMFNTVANNPEGTSDTVFINVAFSTPVDDSKLEIEDFNPFIFTDKTRGNEVHLADFVPTDLANTNLFGTVQDASVPGNGTYYRTANGLPWAIMIDGDFDHPVEQTAITDAYNFFDDWAISGGQSHLDWYLDSPGNQVVSKLFGLQ